MTGSISYDYIPQPYNDYLTQESEYDYNYVNHELESDQATYYQLYYNVVGEPQIETPDLEEVGNVILLGATGASIVGKTYQDSDFLIGQVFTNYSTLISPNNLGGATGVLTIATASSDGSITQIDRLDVISDVIITTNKFSYSGFLRGDDLTTLGFIMGDGYNLANDLFLVDTGFVDTYNIGDLESIAYTFNVETNKFTHIDIPNVRVGGGGIPDTNGIEELANYSNSNFTFAFRGVTSSVYQVASGAIDTSEGVFTLSSSNLLGNFTYTGTPNQGVENYRRYVFVAPSTGGISNISIDPHTATGAVGQIVFIGTNGETPDLYARVIGLSRTYADYQIGTIELDGSSLFNITSATSTQPPSLIIATGTSNGEPTIAQRIDLGQASVIGNNIFDINYFLTISNPQEFIESLQAYITNLDIATGDTNSINEIDIPSIDNSIFVTNANIETLSQLSGGIINSNDVQFVTSKGIRFRIDDYGRGVQGTQLDFAFVDLTNDPFGGSNNSSVTFNGDAFSNSYTLAHRNLLGVLVANGAILSPDVRLYNYADGIRNATTLTLIDTINQKYNDISGLVDFKSKNTLTLIDGLTGGTNTSSVTSNIDGFENLYKFKSEDGNLPYGNMVKHSNGYMYGIAFSGGENYKGSLFQFNPVNKEFNTIHSFEENTGYYPIYSLLISSNGKLYGMVKAGGSSQHGGIYEYDIENSQYTLLHEFNPFIDDILPLPLVEQNDVLYGIYPKIGANNLGVIFSYNISTSNYSVLYDITSSEGTDAQGFSEGENGKLYFTTKTGLANNYGGIITYDILTNSCSVSYSFTSPCEINCPLLLVGNKLYGVTEHSGDSNQGSIFYYDIIDNNFQIIYSFSDIGGLNSYDGINPQFPLIRYDENYLYGTTPYGGIFGYGVIFRVSLIDNSYKKVYDIGFYTGLSDNETGSPFGPLLVDGGNLYGLANGENGTIYRYSPQQDKRQVLVNTVLSGSNIISGITGGTGFGTGVSGLSTTYNDVSFDGFNGSYPQGKLIDGGDGYLYGLCTYGGGFNMGTIIRYNKQTKAIQLLYEFDGTHGSYPIGTLCKADNGLFYGICVNGGNTLDGVIFSYNPVNNVYVVVYSFDFNSGSQPSGTLIQANNGLLYGVCSHGGLGYGTIFKYDIASNTYTKLYDLNSDNGDGTIPVGSFLQDENGKLYAVTSQGGDYDAGTIFEYNIITETFTKLYDIDGVNEGSKPLCDLIGVDGFLYGTCLTGGSSGQGTIFKFEIASGNYTILYRGSDGSVNGNVVGGNSPYSGLIDGGNGKLYGVMYDGGIPYGNGEIYSIDVLTNLYNTVYSFQSDIRPKGSLLKENNVLYGMGAFSQNSNGVIYECTLSYLENGVGSPTGITGISGATGVTSSIYDFIVDTVSGGSFSQALIDEFNQTLEPILTLINDQHVIEQGNDNSLFIDDPAIVVKFGNLFFQTGLNSVFDRLGLSNLSVTVPTPPINGMDSITVNILPDNNRIVIRLNNFQNNPTLDFIINTVGITGFSFQTPPNPRAHLRVSLKLQDHPILLIEVDSSYFSLLQPIVNSLIPLIDSTVDPLKATGASAIHGLKQDVVHSLRKTVGFVNRSDKFLHNVYNRVFSEAENNYSAIYASASSFVYDYIPQPFSSLIQDIADSSYNYVDYTVMDMSGALYNTYFNVVGATVSDIIHAGNLILLGATGAYIVGDTYKAADFLIGQSQITYNTFITPTNLTGATGVLTVVTGSSNGYIQAVDQLRIIENTVIMGNRIGEGGAITGEDLTNLGIILGPGYDLANDLFIFTDGFINTFNIAQVDSISYVFNFDTRKFTHIDDVNNFGLSSVTGIADYFNSAFTFGFRGINNSLIYNNTTAAIVGGSYGNLSLNNDNLLGILSVAVTPPVFFNDLYNVYLTLSGLPLTDPNFYIDQATYSVGQVIYISNNGIDIKGISRTYLNYQFGSLGVDGSTVFNVLSPTGTPYLHIATGPSNGQPEFTQMFQIAENNIFSNSNQGIIYTYRTEDPFTFANSLTGLTGGGAIDLTDVSGSIFIGNVDILQLDQLTNGILVPLVANKSSFFNFVLTDNSQGPTNSSLKFNYGDAQATYPPSSIALITANPSGEHIKLSNSLATLDYQTHPLPPVVVSTQSGGSAIDSTNNAVTGATGLIDSITGAGASGVSGIGSSGASAIDSATGQIASGVSAIDSMTGQIASGVSGLVGTVASGVSGIYGSVSGFTQSVGATVNSVIGTALDTASGPETLILANAGNIIYTLEYYAGLAYDFATGAPYMILDIASSSLIVVMSGASAIGVTVASGISAAHQAITGIGYYIITSGASALNGVTHSIGDGIDGVTGILLDVFTGLSGSINSGISGASAFGSSGASSIGSTANDTLSGIGGTANGITGFVGTVASGVTGNIATVASGLSAFVGTVASGIGASGASAIDNLTGLGGTVVDGATGIISSGSSAIDSVTSGVTGILYFIGTGVYMIATGIEYVGSQIVITGLSAINYVGSTIGSGVSAIYGDIITSASGIIEGLIDVATGATYTIPIIERNIDDTVYALTAPANPIFDALSGATGFVYATVASGVSGIMTGLSGVSGIGNDIITGITGPTISTGITGLTGTIEDNTTGISGLSGATSLTGIDTPTGLSGIIGSGLSGITNNDGLSGATGILASGMSGLGDTASGITSMGGTIASGVSGVVGSGLSGATNSVGGTVSDTLNTLDGFMFYINSQTGAVMNTVTEYGTNVYDQITGVTGLSGVTGVTGLSNIIDVLGYMTGVTGVTGVILSITSATGITGLVAAINQIQTVTGLSGATGLTGVTGVVNGLTGLLH